jgi:hypothetical protein
MNAETVCWLIAFALLAAAFLALGLGRAAGRGSRAEEALGRVWDFDAEEWVDLPYGAEPGPKQMTRQQIEGADGMELSWLAPAYDPATDPEWAAGRARLLDAIRDEQNKGEA